MTDYEMLLLAAKAADLCVLPVHGHDDGKLYDRDYNEWNPLTDDGDALRLAVDLGLLDGGRSYATLRSEEISNGLDPFMATRRAIVRAAAEIGQSMK